MLELVASQPWLMLLSKFSKSSNVEELDFGWVMTASKDDAYFGTDKFRSLSSSLFTFYRSLW